MSRDYATMVLPLSQDSSLGVSTLILSALCAVKKEESISHLFTNCQWAERVWFLSPLGKGPQIHPLDAVGTWLMTKVRKENHRLLELLSLTMWSIRVSRNNMIFRSGQADLMTTSRRAVSMLEDYQEESQSGTRELHRTRNWSPPLADVWKINTNIAYWATLYGDWVWCAETTMAT